MTKKFCLAYNLMVESCLNESCPIRPCSFKDFVKDMSDMFHQKGFSKNQSNRMGRKIVLDAFTGEANGNSE